MIEAHTSRALHYGFQYQSSKLPSVFTYCRLQRKQVFFVPGPTEPALGSRQEMADRQRRTEKTVHSGHGVAHRHGVPRISVIARTDGDKIIALRTALCILILHRHLQGNLHGHRTTVGIEYLPHGRRNDRKQQFAQFYGRRMRQSAEHDMRHILKLLLYCPVQNGMIVSVDGTPPRRHPFNQLRSVFQNYFTTLCPPHFISRERTGGRSIRMPQMLPVEIIRYLVKVHILPV